MCRAAALVAVPLFGVVFTNPVDNVVGFLMSDADIYEHSQEANCRFRLTRERDLGLAAYIGCACYTYR